MPVLQTIQAGFQRMGQGFQRAGRRIVQLKDSAKLKITATFAAIGQFWQNKHNSLKENSLYARYIEPLICQPTNLLLLGGSSAVAAAVAMLATKTFGMIYLAPAVVGSSLIFAGAMAFVQYRMTKYLDRAALAHVNTIKTQAESAAPNFSTILKEISDLEKYQFEHLKNDIKNLRKETNRFRDLLNRVPPPDNASLQQAKDAFVGYLEGLQKKLR